MGNRAESLEQTKKLCALLDEHKLIRPWKIKIKSDDDEISISDLYCIDEEKLAELPTSGIEELHRTHALAVIYGQLFSMHNLELLADIGQNKVNARVRNEAQVPELNFDLIDDGNSLNFENL